MKVILATNNKHKVEEFRRVLSPLGIEIFSQKELDINIEVEENGTTFEQNSMLKAKAIYDITKMPTIADDSGLEVDYLDKAPGIYSARYVSETATDKQRCLKILDELDGVEDDKRVARFVCVISFIDENGQEFCFRGECEGQIGFEIKGENGFGYDPIFLYDGVSMAEMSPDKKDKISHRGNAIKKLVKYFEN